MTMPKQLVLLALLGLPVLACSGPSTPAASTSASSPNGSADETPPSAAPAHDDPSAVFDSAGQSVAYFAGGCFWCMERPFEELGGVSEVVSGYIDGEVANPTYRQVSSGSTGHTEGIRVVYDQTQITYAALLEVFWRNIDPTDEGGQ
ncbi:MAG: peptide-methionine (S)-S-oxide reductase, partial [Polyangiales bacterium]